MTEEEKKAIEKIDYIQDFIIENGQYNADVEEMHYFSTVLNLIQKQDTEINKLNNVIDRIIECVLLHKPFATFVCQNVSVNECNKYRENGGCNQCVKEYFMKEDK